MSFSYSFRDKPRLSDRIRGKSGDELFKELRKELDHDRKSFFDTPSSNFGSSTGSSFPRAGHLFEGPLMREHTDIRSHLEDLAQRHPEFADQLRYPAWSNDNRSNTWGRKRRGSGQSDTGEASKQQPPETVQPDTSEETLRGRTKENLRNTVPDMGQKQQQEAEDKESRGQRSWSAPPDNRSQQADKPRFISKIEIHPVNPDASQQPQSGDATKPPMAPPKPQPQSQPQQPQPKHSTVRHIPIFVEGRDEPVLPKNIEPEFTQSQAPPQQNFSRPPPQPHFTPSQHHFQPQTPPRKQQTPPQHEQQQTSPQPKPESPPTQPEQVQQPPSVNLRDPLYRVECVQKDVDELKAKVENFSGASRSDKEYVILDELLTRNLIKLDDIETEGKDEVRAARKNTIKCIQRCISVLENKVPVPGGGKTEEEMDIEQEAPNTVASGGSENVQSNIVSEQPSADKKMEVERQVSQETSTSQTNENAPGEEKKEVSTGDETKATPSNEASENKAA